MSDPREPSSLLQDPSLGEDLRAVLESGTSHDPSPAELASLGKRLSSALPPGTLPGGGGGGAPGAGAAGAGGATLSATTKALIGIALVSAVGAIPLLSRHHPSTKPEPAPSASASSSESASASASAPASAPAFASSSASASPLATASALPALEPEGQLLARAHDALLRGSPERALALTAEHARAYPHGDLAQEREVIAIESLVAAHRLPDARRRAAAFRAAFPGSSHQPRIDRLIEDP